jgi:redox-sensitive bicupin YhaK (pirin superfamily)
MSAVLATFHLGFPWDTFDPFLFCVHHDDRYPAGNEAMGPAASLAGRDLGNDFTVRDGWRMYHGRVVPGFPQHPHRGFETLTLARAGLIDHSDSLGARARFGNGDAQWMTAGRGIVHAEMFPLLRRDGPNPAELFQLWINLPARSKRVPPHFAMLWSGEIPRHTFTDSSGRTTEVVTVAGPLAGRVPPRPPPHSWAADPANELAVWTIRLQPGATWVMPPASPGVGRTLYAFRGKTLRVGGVEVPARIGLRVDPSEPLVLANGPEETEILVLQGRPIGEPVAHHGPFVMNTRAELQQAFDDYRATRFGGWPWPEDDPVHGREEGRFAQLADGRVERPA